MARRTKITWKDPELRKKKLLPHLYVFADETCIEKYRYALVIGTPWIVTVSLSVEIDSDNRLPHIFPYLYLYNAYVTTKPTFPVGTLAVYTGTVRVEEEGRGGITLCSIRHTFMIGDRRFLVHSFSYYAPAA